jgi:sugar phosphate permease
MTGKFLCGWAADKFGGKRTFAVGLFVASVFVGLFAMSSSVAMFQLAFFFTLMAQAAGWPSMTKIITNWIPPKKYGEVWGILSTSSRVGTLTATFVLGSLLSWISWRGMLWIASGTGFLVMIWYALTMNERPASDVDLNDPHSGTDSAGPADMAAKPAHPLDGLTLPQALPLIFGNVRFLLISGSMMGLTILWDFLLMAPMYLQDTLQLDNAQASRAASAFPLGSLISVLIGGFVFDRLNRRKMAWVLAGMLAAATACLLTFALLPQWDCCSFLASAFHRVTIFR